MELNPLVWRRANLPSPSETCDPHIVSVASEASDLLKLVQCAKYRDYMRGDNNIMMLEEAFDKLREILTVLHREDA